MKLLESYIRRAELPMFSDHKVPVVPVNDGTQPVIAIERWKLIDNSLNKVYRFIDDRLRNMFMSSLLEYETEIGHNGHIVIDHGIVSIKVTTKDVGKVSELDKEYAKYCDLLYKDILYNDLG